MTEKAGGRPGRRRRGAAGTPRRRPWLVPLTLGATVLVIGGVLLAAGRGDDTAAVERFDHIHGLAVPAWAGGDVFVSTHAGLLRIDEQGVWRYVGGTRHDFMGFTAHPSEPGVLYSSGHPAPGSGLPNPIGFMVSRDHGGTWQTIALAGRADFHVLAVQSSDGDVLVGFNTAVEPGLYRSRDGGHTWTIMPGTTLMELGGPMALAIDPADPDVLLAGTRAGLLRSEDGGERWHTLSLEGVPVTALAFDPLDPRRLYGYAAGAYLGVLVSEDAGASWLPAGLVLDGGDAIAYLAADPNHPGVLYAGSYGQDLYRQDGRDAQWQALALNGVPQVAGDRAQR